MRTLQPVSVLLVTGLLLSILQPVSAVVAEAALLASDPAPSADLAELAIAFEQAVSLEEAIELTHGLDGLVGYRFANGELLGEYRLAVRPPSEFLTSFEQKFATQPRIVAAVIEKDEDDANHRKAIPSEVFTQSTTPFSPDPVVNSLNELPMGLDRSGELQAIAATELWKPETADIEIRRLADQAMVSQSYRWTEGSPGDQPDGFGMEWGVNLFSDYLRGKNPLCPMNYEEDFVMDSREVEMYIWSPGMTDSVAPDFYWDTEVQDSCGRRTITVGSRYPEQIPGQLGQTQLDIYIYGAIGEEDRSRVTGDVSLIDDSACEDIPEMVTNLCMGLYLIDPPTSANNPRYTLGDNRAWYAAPELCWSSGDYGRAAPERWCGSTPDWSGAIVNEIEPYVSSGSAVGVSLTYTGDLASAAALPAFGPPRDPNILNRDEIVDVLWWDDSGPVPASSEEAWALDIDEVEGSVTLSNPAVNFDRSRTEIAALFDDGAVTFRAGRMENLNTLVLSELSREWDAATVDPFDCGVGSPFYSDDYADSAGIGYSAEGCSFYLGSPDIADIGYGTPSLTGSRPGYMFNGGWWGSVWIPGSDEYIWSPVNGSSIYVDYYDAATAAYVPFFATVQNVDEQYAQGWQSVANFDPDLPAVNAEVSQRHHTETEYTEENGWDCDYPQSQIPECERWYTRFKLDSLFSSPEPEWGEGWDHVAQNGGRVRFTTSAGVPLILDVEPQTFNLSWINQKEEPGDSRVSSP